LSMLQLGGLEGEGEGNISEQQQQLANVSRRRRRIFFLIFPFCETVSCEKSHEKIQHYKPTDQFLWTLRSYIL